jgi:hypothetical protein
MLATDELDEELAAELCTMVQALQRWRPLLTEDPLHNSVFECIDEAIRQLEQAAGELMNPA